VFDDNERDKLFIRLLLDVDEEDDEDEEDEEEEEEEDESDVERVAEFFGICNRFSPSIVFKFKLFDDVDVFMSLVASSPLDTTVLFDDLFDFACPELAVVVVVVEADEFTD